MFHNNQMSYVYVLIFMHTDTHFIQHIHVLCSGILLGIPLYSSCNPHPCSQYFPAAVKHPLIQNPIIVEQMSEIKLSALIVICSG